MQTLSRSSKRERWGPEQKPSLLLQAESQS
jgi:hypothetical protein